MSRQRLLLEDRRFSPTRAAEAGAGAGLLAWGGPRIQMLGPALEHGANMAKDTRLRAALVQAEGLRRQWLTGSEPLGRLGRVGPVSEIGRRIPPALRPAAAVVAGAGLLRHGIPPSRTRRTPVVGLRG